MRGMIRRAIAQGCLLAILSTQVGAQAVQPAAAPQAPNLRPPTRADILRGEYGRYRANNDLLFYHLDVRVDPDKKFDQPARTRSASGCSQDDTRIQLDLYANLAVDRDPARRRRR